MKKEWTRARLIETPVFSSAKWVAGTWQYPPHRVGVKITEDTVAQPEPEGLRPSGTRTNRQADLGIAEQGIFAETNTCGW